MKGYKGECEVLQLGRGNCGHSYTLGASCPEHYAEEDLMVLVDTHLSVSQQPALAAGFHMKKSVVSRSREVVTRS